MKMHSKRQPLQCLVLATLAYACLAVAPAHATNPITLDTNPHYLNYNSQTTVLAGMSGDDLPHVLRPDLKDTFCTFDVVNQTTGQRSYQRCSFRLQAFGLNKMQLWISLNSSSGLERLTPPAPYQDEQPFTYSAPLWNLNSYNSTYFSNLNAVITDALSRNPNIIVEVVLFDPWNGYHDNPSTSPWSPGRNTGFNGNGNTVDFTQNRYMVSYEHGSGNPDGGTDSTPSIQNARILQQRLVAQVVHALKGFPNIYYEIANEPDLVPANSQTPPDTMAMINWHNFIARTIAANDSNPPHLIAVNMMTQNALNLASLFDSNIKIVNGHYVELINSPSSTITFGALPLIENYWNGPNGSLALTFGFNESRSVPIPVIVGARAEAWEFMLNEGSVYDNYNVNFIDPGSAAVRGYLGRLLTFLQPISLTNINWRQNGSSPGWAGGLSASGTQTAEDQPTGKTYWGAIQHPNHSYALYLHHSCLTTILNQHRYKPVCSSAGYQETLQLVPGKNTGSVTYKVDWITPDQDAPVCSQVISWAGTGFVQVTSPKYPFDLALRLTLCSGSSCPTLTDCSTAQSPACPLNTYPDAATCP